MGDKMNEQKKAVNRIIEDFREMGYQISDEEACELESYCLRKMEAESKPKEYFELLFPDVLKEYFFGCTINLSTLINNSEV